MAVPQSISVMLSCVLSTVFPSHGHFAYSFGSPFLSTSFLMAEMYTSRVPSSHVMSSNLKCNYFTLEFLISIFPSIFHIILLWLLFHREFAFESDQKKLCFFFFLTLMNWLSSQGLPGLIHLGDVFGKKACPSHPPSSIRSLVLPSSLSVTKLLQQACREGLWWIWWPETELWELMQCSVLKESDSQDLQVHTPTNRSCIFLAA